MRDELARIAGVGDVTLSARANTPCASGSTPSSIAARGMTAEEVVAARCSAQNMQVAGGAARPAAAADMGAFQLSCSTQGRLLEPSEFENIIVKTRRRRPRRAR